MLEDFEATEPPEPVCSDQPLDLSQVPGWKDEVDRWIVELINARTFAPDPIIAAELSRKIALLDGLAEQAWMYEDLDR